MRHSRKKPTAGPAATFRSLNVEKDLDVSNIMDRYVLTANALTATRRILAAVANGTGGAWTLTGPFGTGKSAYCLFLSHLLGTAQDRTTPRAIVHLRNADERLNRQLFRTSQSRLNYETLAISGTSEPISLAICRAITNAPILQVSKDARPVLRRARTLLAALKSGNSLQTSDIVDLLDAAINVACGSRRSRGVLLVLDEVGKFLEFAAQNPAGSDIFLLQQLGEYAARSQGRLLFVSVLHQDFREYGTALTSVERAEWDKIRGRFEDIAFEEPPSQLLRFLAQATENSCGSGEVLLRRPTTVRVIRHLEPAFWKLGIMPAGLRRDDARKLLRSCAPLHPLVAILLGPLFRRVGQNERSAFSFLTSDDPTALRLWSQLQHKHGRHLYDIVDLYDHLSQSLGGALLHTRDAKRWAEAFEAESRHPSLTAKAVVVLRAIALLGIVSRWSGVRATQDTLRVVLSERLTPPSIDAALKELQVGSVIVHRRFDQSFSVWEGSDVDIEARLLEGRSRIADSAESVSLLRQHFHVRPVLARRHSFVTGTLRLFEVAFVNAHELEHESTNALTHDGRIIIVFSKPGVSAASQKRISQRLGERDLMCLVGSDSRVTAGAHELAVIDWAQKNTPELTQDGSARRELHERRLSTERQLRVFVDRVLSAPGDKDATWIHNGKVITIADGRALNERLSRICDQVFHAAPRLENEIINRHDLSSSAAAARRELLKVMIEKSMEPELGLDGNPPERSIYRSLLSVEGLRLHRKCGDAWSFRTPAKSQATRAGSAYALFDHIDSFFASAEQAPRPFDALFDSLRQPPFGLRNGPIPIFICVALLANEADVALYHDGQFCPTVSAPLFETLVKSPERFAVRRLRLGGVTSEVFERLGRLLGQVDLVAGGAKQQVLAIARPLLRFANSLSEFARTTAELSVPTVGVRNVLYSSKQPEEMLLTELPNACGLRPFRTRDRARTADISRFVDTLRAAIIELRDCLPQLQSSVCQAIGDAFGEQGASPESRASLQARATALREFAVEQDLRILLDRLAADSENLIPWVDGVASFVGERPLAKWRDEDRPRFALRLRQFARRFALLEATIASRPQAAKLNGTESIRIALTSTRFGQVDHALHVDRSQATRIRSIAQQIDSTIDGNDPAVAVAALCSVLQRHLSGNGEFAVATPNQGRS